ncbi:MAG: rhodanese-like domain-containing protein [Bdellovibrionota bacterium]
MNYHITAFYRFFKINDNLQNIKEKIEQKALELDLRGLMILGPEGINSTTSAPSKEALDSYKHFLKDFFKMDEFNFKDSQSEKLPFRKFLIKIRKEIVTFDTPELIPDMGINNHHLSPTEWNQIMKDDKEHFIIDTRNWYEYNIGTFKGALNPNIDKFTDFPKYLEEQKISKDKKMLIFCTGGIRCEKGILELQRQGYENVYQLEGGILKYLEEYPNDQFTGECFVFDHRVALDQNLKPSTQYGLCPHCGQPSSIQIDCKRCDTKTLICEDCEKLEWKKHTCSKNCAYHFELHPERKAPPQVITRS